MTLKLHKTGIEFPDGSWQSTAGANGDRNMLINGSMAVNQRQYAQQGVNEYTLDRWYAWGNLSNTSQGFDGTKHFLRQSRQAADWSGITQTIETKNMIHAIGHKVTLSFKLRVGSAFDGTISFGVRYRTDAEGQIITGTTNPLLGSGGFAIDSGNASTEWQTYTMPSDLAVSANALALGIQTVHTSTVLDDNNYYDITHVQLEVSDDGKATSFEHRPSDVELRRCEHYYQEMYRVSMGLIANGGVSNIRQSYMLPTSMRVAPTITPGTITAGYSLNVNSVGKNAWNLEVGGTSEANFRPQISSPTKFSAEL